MKYTPDDSPLVTGKAGILSPVVLQSQRFTHYKYGLSVIWKYHRVIFICYVQNKKKWSELTLPQFCHISLIYF